MATQSGYARMSGKDRTTIVKRCKGCESGSIKTAEVLTDGGLQGCELIPASLVFKWAIKDNPELAEAMGAAGATVYMHQLAGFKIDSEAIAKPKPTPPQPQPQKQELPPIDIRIVNLFETLKSAGLESDPHGKRILQNLIESDPNS